jgi:hypothetical protein
MIPLPRALCCGAVPLREPRFDARPLQAGMGECAWRVAVASVLLCRTRRAQAEVALQGILTRWRDAAELARSDTEELECTVRPCGLHRNRARQLQRLSTAWHGAWWNDLRDLPGVGKYVADAVSLFCFGHTELESKDYALIDHARAYAKLSMSFADGIWALADPLGAVLTSQDPLTCLGIKRRMESMAETERSQGLASRIMELRRRTALPMLKCRDALVRCGGDVELALLKLRHENSTAEGTI